MMKLTRLMGALAAVAMAGRLLDGGALPAAEPDRDDQRPPQVLPKGFESTDQLQHDLEHSAHLGQEVEVHYRWHALYGRRLRRQYVERRAGGDVVHVEVTPGAVIVVAAWMLDRAACAGMSLGAPRVKLAALAGLHQLVVG